MFGKSFASMYVGSMFGKPAIVFAVWGYVISNQRPSGDGQCFVELNPQLLAATFSTTPEDVMSAIETLCSPDPGSRSKASDGRRLVALEPGKPGPAQYHVVNGGEYRAMRDEDDRREYLKQAKRESRARQHRSTSVNNVNRGQPPSSQAEAEAEADLDLSSSSENPTPATSEPEEPETPGKKPENQKQKQETADIRRVFEAWREVHGHPKAKLDQKRRSRIRSRLREGFTADQLVEAIRGAKRDSFLMGGGRDGKVYDGLETLLRDASQVERLIELAVPGRSSGPEESPEDREARMRARQRVAELTRGIG